MEEYKRIHEKDNVAVALKELKMGTKISIDGRTIVLTDTIPPGHKFTIESVKKEESVIKYGYSIGKAKDVLKPGTWVHTHNLRTNLGDIIEYSYEPTHSNPKESIEVYFKGYHRDNNKVGIRNEIWIIPTVGCVNSIGKALAAQGKNLIEGNVEDVIVFPHPYGCSQMGDDQENTRKILGDLVRHPNAGGVLVLGLGCENSNIEILKTYIGDYDEKRVKFLQCQDVEDEMDTGLSLLKDLIDYAKDFKREKVSGDELIIGMKCGGSDGFSGITANPLVGSFSDLLISKRGTTILTEVPEMFGAETILMNRCKDKELYERTVSMINHFKEYFKFHNQVIYENPSPGNKQGGISTLEDKSLGCTQKSGSAPIVDVLDYGDTIKNRGLNLLSAPGNDLVAATALAAAGAHIVLFTTGRGTPFACPVPTVKISSNTELSVRKDNWIDFNAGRLVEEGTMEELTDELFHFILEVASGKKVKSEEAGFQDMAIFKQGVTM